MATSISRLNLLEKAASRQVQLISKILRAIQDTFEAEHPELDRADIEMAAAMARASCFQDVPGSAPSLLDSPGKSEWTTHVRMGDDIQRSLGPSEHFKECYKDEYTGEQLPQNLIQDAMLDEV